MNVVVRFCGIFNKWYICHAKSYQNAFGSKVNGFVERDDAISFAEKNKCTIDHHKDDLAQGYARRVKK